jgi:hypothetical protein
MDRYERILTLHRILKAARYPVSFARLKDEVTCSRATLYRDIAFLRDALGAPIEYGEDEATFRYAAGEGDRFELPGDIAILEDTDPLDRELAIAHESAVLHGDIVAQPKSKKAG